MTNNKQQTAVEWSVEKLASLTFDYMAGFISKREYDQLSKGVIRQAKEMEKEQHRVTAQDFYYGSHSFKNFEQYYDEIYGGEEQ